LGEIPGERSSNYSVEGTVAIWLLR